jgi:ankyrin repeat protein
MQHGKVGINRLNENIRENHLLDNPELLKLFLEYADDLETHDGLGWTPLATAVNRDSKENVKILLKRGAKIDCDSVQGIDLIATAMAFNDIGM